MSFLSELFSSEGFMPHGHCYLWNPGLVWLHVISDGLTALAYTTIPFTLWYFVHKRRDIPFHWMFLCFGLFIIACGSTHVLEIWTLWNPTYWLSGVVKAITAAASVPTALLLIKLMPKLITIPTHDQLQRVLAELQQAHHALETRVKERTADLTQRNIELAEQVAERLRAERERQQAEAAVAQLREARAADAKFRALLEAAPDAMLIVDAEGCVVLVNAQTERLFGYERDALIGKTVELLIPGHPRLNALPSRDRGPDRELFGRRKDGTEFPVDIRSSPLETKDGTLISSAIRDVTERRREEAELRRARDVAETASRELEAFSYSVAHDLRSPLRAINGFSETVMEDLGEKLDSESRQSLQHIGASAVRMGQLIDSLLNLSKVSRAELRRERVELSVLAEEVMQHLRRSEPHRNVRFEAVAGLATEGDPDLIRALLENLLANAWKFTAQREVARVVFGCNHEGGVTTYFVQDNGAGFESAYTEKLFRPFQRLHKETEFAGTGIGLATVQRIVRRHGGNIWARGQAGQGATFFFTLGNPSPAASLMVANDLYPGVSRPLSST